MGKAKIPKTQVLELKVGSVCLPANTVYLDSIWQCVGSNVSIVLGAV